MLDIIIGWAQENKAAIAAFLYALYNLYQYLSKYWAQNKSSAAKLINRVVERTTFCTSKGCKTDGPLSRLKLPWQDVPPAEERKEGEQSKPPRSTPSGTFLSGAILLALIVALLGCAAKQLASPTLVELRDQLQAKSEQAIKEQNAKCLNIAKACAGAQKLESCPGYLDCDKQRGLIAQRYFLALDELARLNAEVSK